MTTLTKMINEGLVTLNVLDEGEEIRWKQIVLGTAAGVGISFAGYGIYNKWLKEKPWMVKFVNWITRRQIE